MTQTQTRPADHARLLRRPVGSDDTHPVHARDAERWSETQWRRWCIEQAVAARGSRENDVQDMAERLMRFVCPSTALAQPIE